MPVVVALCVAMVVVVALPLRAQATRAPDRSKMRVRLGSVALNPTADLTNLGVDTNAFNDPKGLEPDFISTRRRTLPQLRRTSLRRIGDLRSLSRIEFPETMGLRIGFDLDGVLADMDGALLAHATTLFGDATAEKVPAEKGLEEGAAADEPPVDAPAPTALTVSPRQHGKLWRHVQSIDNFWETLVEIEPGAIARLAAIADERRWQVIFLTKRPESAGYTAQRQTQRWLESRGFALPSVYVVQGSRGRIAAALDLDIVVDDRAENCLDVVVDSKARAILVWRDDERNLATAARRLGIGVVKTVNECLDILTKVDAPGSEPSGLMARVRRALGLKEPAESA